jgi:hypothetical protein
MNQSGSRTLGIASRLKDEKYMAAALVVGVIAYAGRA